MHHKDIREAILDATDRLLTRYGYRKMTIDDLAQEVGIGKGTVYLYFPSKEEIALSHVDRIIERLKSRLRTIAADTVPASEKIRRMLVERVVFRFDSVQHYTQSLNDLLAQVRPTLLERRKRYFSDEARIFAEVIDEGIRGGEFFSPDPHKCAETLIVATNSLLPYSLSTLELGAREDIVERVTQVAELCLSGLMTRNGRSK